MMAKSSEMNSVWDLDKNSVLTPGLQEYLDWSEKVTFGQNPRTLIMSIFRKFDEIGILEQFISHSLEEQDLIIKSLDFGVTYESISVLLDLLDVTGLDFRNVNKWRVDVETVRPRDPDCPNISREFEVEFARFLKFQKVFRYYDRTSSRRLDGMIVLLLVKVYEEDRVLQAMRSWSSNTVTNGISHFKNIVDNWSAYESVYIDWTLELIGARATAN